jgi:hypothetical protein
MTTVRPQTLLQMTGSDLYCTVLGLNGAPVVSCFHDPGGTRSSRRKGYAIAAGDELVGVEPTGSHTLIFFRLEPPQASAGFAGGAAKGDELVHLNQGDVVAMGGTHLLIGVKQFADAGKSVVVEFTDAHGDAIDGAYCIAISNRDVVIAKKTGSTYHTVYEHHVYGQ